MIWKYIIAFFVGYAIGNINFARIISHHQKKDITKQGSGNPGTMNMLRTFGFKLGILTLVLDTLKGVLAAVAGYFIFKGFHFTDNLLLGAYVGGLGVILGHNFPVIYKFKGGKGVACILGLFCVVNPLWSLIAFVIGFLYLVAFDYAAVTSFIFLTIVTCVEAGVNVSSVPILIILAVIYLLTMFMHRGNIKRLMLGEEKKVNFIQSLKNLKKR